MMREGGPLAVIDVLDADKYSDFHLPGALNVALSGNFEMEFLKVVPDRDTPVVVYCQDIDCDASHRAGRRLDQMGYLNVYDYQDGKADWRAAGFPIESKAASEVT